MRNHLFFTLTNTNFFIISGDVNILMSKDKTNKIDLPKLLL